MKVEKIDHIAIRVKNDKTERVIGLFSELFGTEYDKIGEFEEEGKKSWVSFMDPLGIEVVGSLNPDGMVGKQIEQRGEGIFLLSLKVTDFDEAVQEMESHGIKEIRRGIYHNRRVAIYDPEDTFGVMIELIEYKPQHPLVTVWI